MDKNEFITFKDLISILVQYWSTGLLAKGRNTILRPAILDVRFFKYLPLVCGKSEMIFNIKSNAET